MKKLDNIITYVIILITLVYGYKAINLPQYGGVIGAGFFPKILTVVLLCLAVIYCILNCIVFEGEDKEFKLDNFKPKEWICPVLIISILLAYSYSLFNFGFKLPTFIMLILMMKVYNAKNWRTMIIIALVCCIVFDFVFRGLFRVPLHEIELLNVW